MRTSQNASFLTLPREIRDQIYGYILPYKKALRVRTQSRRYYRIYNNQLGCLRITCRQLWDEGSEFLYAGSRIKFVEGIREISQCLANFIPLVGNYIQAIELRPHFLDMDRGYVREPHSRGYRPSYKVSVGHPGRICQQEIRRTLLLLGSLPRLRSLSIRPYGGDLVDFLGPMRCLYGGLVILSGKANLRDIRIEIKLSGEDKPRLAYTTHALVLSQLLGREPLSDELPDERGYSTITKFPSLNKRTVGTVSHMP